MPGLRNSDPGATVYRHSLDRLNVINDSLKKRLGPRRTNIPAGVYSTYNYTLGCWGINRSYIYTQIYIAFVREHAPSVDVYTVGLSHNYIKHIVRYL